MWNKSCPLMCSVHFNRWVHKILDTTSCKTQNFPFSLIHQVKSSFEATMVWGESQMDRGVSNSAEACAQPGCTPFPSCCRTTSGSPTLDTSRAIPWHAWVVLVDQTHKYTVIACCQWLCIGCCIVLSSIESLYYILYYVVTSLYSWLYSHMCFCVMKNILCWWW